MERYQLLNVLQYTLDELQEECDIYAQDLEGKVKESFEDFIEDYTPPEEQNLIKVDCKVDMALPTENLQKNLQLLIDRHGVQWLNNVIETLYNGQYIEFSRGHSFQRHTEKDSKILSKTLENPPEPNQALKDAVNTHLKLL